MLGFYECFPENFHYSEIFTYSLSRKGFQQKLLNIFHELNRLSFTFEEVSNPVVPKSSVFFEFGIANSGDFTFLNEAETKNMLDLLDRSALQVMDFFCAVRYYKNKEAKKSPLRFDYFIIRLIFNKEKTIEIQVFHERGPRYLSPEELVFFLVRKINATVTRKILRPAESV